MSTPIPLKMELAVFHFVFSIFFSPRMITLLQVVDSLEKAQASYTLTRIR
jgi:hypothetical protein